MESASAVAVGRIATPLLALELDRCMRIRVSGGLVSRTLLQYSQILFWFEVPRHISIGSAGCGDEVRESLEKGIRGEIQEQIEVVNTGY